jgi:fructose-bisphosphate aldolase class II
MTLSTAAELISDASARSRAVPAFNIITLEQAEAVVGGAEDAGVGVLIQLSQNAIGFHGGFAATFAACRQLAAESSVRIGLHADHIEDDALALAVVERAAELGVGSVMFDRATLPYAENVDLTARIAAAGHSRELWVEGELGEVGGKDGAHAPGVRTDPSEAASFVRETGVDLLAVAVGSSHAMTERAAILDLDLIADLARAVPVPLVLHGSSGVPDAMLSEAVGAGIRKVNVGTVLGIVGTERLRTELAERPTAVDPRAYLRGFRSATRDEVARLASAVG